MLALERGESAICPTEILAIATHTGVDEAWLLTGKNYPGDELLLSQWGDLLPFIEKLPASEQKKLLKWLVELLLPSAPPPVL